MKKFLTFFALLCALLGFSVPISADDYYLRGSHDSTVGTKLVQEGSTTKYSCTVTMPKDAWFKVYNSTLDRWWGYGNSKGDWTIESVPSTHLIWCDTSKNSGEDIYIKSAGTYKFTFDTNGNNVTVSEAEFYFRGGQTGTNWAVNDDYKFNRVGSTTTYTLDIPGGITDEWKIADCVWTGDYVWGGPEKNEPTLTNGTPYSLTKGDKSSNLNCLTNGKAATVTFVYNASGTSTVTVTWQTKPTAPTLPEVATDNKVKITVPDGSTVYYSFVGGAPSTSSDDSWFEYTANEEIELRGATTTIYAAAYKDGEWSDKIQQTYTYGMPVPTVSINANTGWVTITVSNPVSDTDAKIRYTTDGSTPTSSSTPYPDGGFQAKAGQTVKAVYHSPIFGTSTEASGTFTYIMPKPSISIDLDGNVTITVGTTVSDGVIKYGFSESGINQVYDPTNKPKATAGQTVYTQYVSDIFGYSATVSQSYSGPKSIKEIRLYHCDGDKAGISFVTNNDGTTWTAVSNTMDSKAGSGYWNATFYITVTSSDGTTKKYATQATGVAQVDAGKTYTAVEHTSDSGQHGFYVNNCASKKVKVIITTNGLDVATITPTLITPFNNLTFGSSAPQVTGWAVGVTTDSNKSWDSWTDFKKRSDSPKEYVYEFDATDSNAYFMLKINGKMYQPANGSLKLDDGLTYVFDEKTKAEGANQCTLSGLTSGTRYVMTLTDTELGVRLEVSKAGIPTPVFVRDAKTNVVTVNVRSGCTLHYTVDGGEEQTTTSDLTLTIPEAGMTLSAYFTKTDETGKGETVKQTFAYYEAPQKWPIKKWTLSDNDYFPVGTYKYFYMSRFQNDDRVSPEWELLDEGNGTYALRNFMVIPAGEFRIRRIYKKGDNSFDYNDFGLGSTSRLRLKDKFGVSGDNAALEKKLYTSSALSLSKDQSRGYAWDMGYTMASVVVTHSTGANLSVTAIADFTQPSTFNGAPLPGMPVVTLTSSKLMIPTIEGQSVSVATKLDTSHPEYDTAFTNAWIQYDGDSNMLVYGDGIGDGTAVYYSASDHKPQAAQVMNSTILPPRNPVVFKLVDFEGNETRITSDKIILKYNEERSKNTRQLKTPDGTLTKSNAKFAVYELRDMEMAGLYKIYSGYGAHMYGGKDNGVKNGLSLFSNWGVGHQPSKEPYAGSKIESGQAYPLNGGGPKTDSNGYSWRDANNDTNGCYGNEDNWAGRYFEFSKRTYVSKLNFFYALERDTEGNGGKGNWSKLDGNNWNLADDYYNSHHAQRTNDGKDEYYNSKDDTNSPHWGEPNYTNDGVNYSWFNMTYDGSIGRVILSKVGANTGRVLYSINNFVANPGIDALHEYNVHLIKIDPKTGEPITGEGAYDKLVGSGDLNGATELDDQVATEADLTTGWYVARFIFYSDTHDEDTGAELPNQKNELYSTRIFVFGIEGAKIEALQRTSTSEDADRLKLYHPVIDVKPDATEAIAGLVDDSAEGSGVDKSMVYGYVELASISTTAGVTKIVDTEGNALPESAEAAGEGKMYVTYDAANGKATVHYPKGFFSSAAPDMDFAVMNAAIGRYTDFKLTITADNAVKPATDEVSALVSMPGAKLDGQIVAEKREGGVKFNALRLADSANPQLLSGVISYVDAKGQPCGVAEVDDTQILAHVLYGEYDPTDESGYIELTVNADKNSAPTDMKELVGGVKRYAVGAIPYETDDADGVKIRKNQTVPFTVNLDYLVEGYDAAAVNGDCNELDYAATNLTAPRDGIKDIRSESDVLGDGGVATDVTTVSDHYIENHGGLFTNIEDAHVALQAKSINEKLVGNKDFNLWTMEHGKYFPDDATYPDGTTLNPFSPVNHLAIGQSHPTAGQTATAPEQVHNLLRTDGNPVAKEADFKNTTAVNNVWWNQRAYVKPVFHRDHINGVLTFDNKGGVTYDEKGGCSTPKDHQNFWAGVRPENESAYDAVWDNGYIELTGSNAEAAADDTSKPTTYVHDPRHSYYDTQNHHTSVRSAYKQGEIPLNANDILCLIGKGNGKLDGTFSDYYANATHLLNGAAGISEDVMENLMMLHGYDTSINENAGSTEAHKHVSVDDSERNLYFDANKWWNLDNLWQTRADIVFNEDNKNFGGSPAEYLFTNFNNHMIFKVNHVNHESWFVPGAYYQILQHDWRTRPLWPAFKDDDGFKSKTTDEARDNYVMNRLRMNFADYCPLEYTARYSYPFLTSTDYIAGEAVTSSSSVKSRIDKKPAQQTAIETALKAVQAADVTTVVAPSRGRVPFFGATRPEDVVPTVINDVVDDIPGNGFSIVYNRAAGTVTVTALGDRELKDAAVYDISGSSMVLGATADRINDRTIVLDVRGIAQGAYIVSTNLGGAKFMK